ncbi:uncharacterized protein LOC144231725 isoform X2 [Crocuta crocuta]
MCARFEALKGKICAHACKIHLLEQKWLLNEKICQFLLKSSLGLSMELSLGVSSKRNGCFIMKKEDLKRKINVILGEEKEERFLEVPAQVPALMILHERSHRHLGLTSSWKGTERTLHFKDITLLFVSFTASDKKFAIIFSWYQQHGIAQYDTDRSSLEEAKWFTGIKFVHICIIHEVAGKKKTT